MIKVFCISDYFLPGYKGGGPITTLANLRSLLKEEVEFWTYTRDRDLGDKKPYPNISTGKWTHDGCGYTYYSEPHAFGGYELKSLIESNSFDAVYINSFFSLRGSIIPQIILKYFKPQQKIILAPRGEFSPGALKLKSFKKHLFLSVYKMLKLEKHLHWHASSLEESNDIQKFIYIDSDKIRIAFDPVSLKNIKKCEINKEAGTLRMVFISRISRMKNLSHLIKIISGLNSKIFLDIYGPIEDKIYWSECKSAVDSLASNVTAKYCRPLASDEVTGVFSRYDLFAFPTLGENFGHVIFESLNAGTPVIVSEHTPWCHDESLALQVIPNDSIGEWRKAIELAASKNAAEQKAIRASAFEYAKRFQVGSRLKETNLAVFSNFK